MREGVLSMQRSRCDSTLCNWQVDDVRVRATGKAVPLPEPGELAGDPGSLPEPAQETSAYFQVQSARKSARALYDFNVLQECSGISFNVLVVMTFPELCTACRLEGGRKLQHTC